MRIVRHFDRSSFPCNLTSRRMRSAWSSRAQAERMGRRNRHNTVILVAGLI